MLDVVVGSLSVVLGVLGFLGLCCGVAVSDWSNL